jgi:hypothetical protein
MFRKKLIFSLIALLLAFGAAQIATAKGVISRAITTVSDYRAGSAEVAQIQVWLQNHAQFVNGVMVGDPANLGNVRVTYTKISANSVQANSVGDGPPVPLPTSGNPGDVISISSISGGITQNWTYTWVGDSTTGGWVLTSYSYSNKPPGSTH